MIFLRYQHSLPILLWFQTYIFITRSNWQELQIGSDISCFFPNVAFESWHFPQHCMCHNQACKMGSSSKKKFWTTFWLLNTLHILSLHLTLNGFLCIKVNRVFTSEICRIKTQQRVGGRRLQKDLKIIFYIQL